VARSSDAANDPVLTTSSHNIAELLGCRHDDVKRSIERLASRGVATLPPLAEFSNPGMGPKTIKVYNVG
jgi:phage regulator Rha-like protein